MAGNVVSNVKKYYGGQVPVPGQGDSDGKVKVLVEKTTTMEIEGAQTDVDLLYDSDDLTVPVTPQKLGQWTDENYLIAFKKREDDGHVRGFILYALESDSTSADTLVNRAEFIAFKENMAGDPGASAYEFTMVEDSATLSRYLQDENGELTVKFNLASVEAGAQSGHLSDLIDTDSSYMNFDIVRDEDGAYLNLNTDDLDEELEGINERLDVIEDILDELPSDEHGYFNSSLVTTPGDGTTTSLVIDNFRISEGRSVHGDNIEFVQTHQEGGVDFGEVYLNPGTYILNVHYTLQWVGNPRGTFLPLVANVGEQPFDFSYEHEDILRSTRIVTRTTRGKFGLNFPFDADTPPMGIWVKYLEIAQIASYSHPAVTHDSTLAGSGQIGDPLGVTPDAFGKVKDIPTSISQFRNGDVIPVDGPNGPAKMGKDNLLKETAQNALADNVAPAFDPDHAETYPAGSLVIHEGELRKFTTDHPTGPWISGDNKKVVLSSLIGGSGVEIEAGVNVLVETLGGVVTISVPSTDLAIDTESMGAQVENNTIILSARSAFKCKTLLFENIATYPNNLYEFLQTYPLSESLNNYDYVMFEYIGNADTLRTGVVEVALFKVVPGPMAVVLHGYHINENVTPATTWENLAFLKSNSSNTSFSYAEATKFRSIDGTSWSSPQNMFTVNKIWGLK